ncbi:MAG: S26 family signal peptidase, partial [Pseudomonadales bacterium]|nr:S26 family signal peptidase [Pseudomonadales bacterium]
NDQLFVMGDNRANSRDSRWFGPIDVDLLVGEVFVRIWPLSNIGRT